LWIRMIHEIFCCDFHIKIMLGSSLPPIVFRRALVLFTLFVYSGVQHYIVYRRGNQKWTIQRNWQHRVHKTKKTKQKHNMICVGHPVYDIRHSVLTMCGEWAIMNKHLKCLYGIKLWIEPHAKQPLNREGMT
jgi:hypothetical protein